MAKKDDGRIGVRFEPGTTKRIALICETLYFGESVSNYIRKVVLQQVQNDEQVLVYKGVLKSKNGGFHD